MICRNAQSGGSVDIGCLWTLVVLMIFLLSFVCTVCILKVFMPSVSSPQSLTLGTRVHHCGES